MVETNPSALFHEEREKVCLTQVQAAMDATWAWKFGLFQGEKAVGLEKKSVLKGALPQLCKR